jgi:hypothetical protein
VRKRGWYSNSHFARLGFGNPEGAIPAETDYSTDIMRIAEVGMGGYLPLLTKSVKMYYNNADHL